MSKKNYLHRYIKIVESLQHKGKTFEEIQETLYSDEMSISLRTFQRDKEDIESLFGIKILYNKKDGNYEIDHQFTDEKYSRFSEAFNIVSTLNQNNALSKYIYLQRRPPNGSEYFANILQAISQQVVITFQLHSYWNPATNRRCIPKAIKEAHYRWYLIGYDLDKKAFRNYGLDRISNLKVTSSVAKSPDIAVEEHYKNAFGIETYKAPLEVILKFENSQKEYLKSLPLHPSQKIIEENDTHFQISLYIHPTNDFTMEILRLSQWCEVLQPIKLRNQTKELFSEKLKLYKE